MAGGKKERTRAALIAAAAAVVREKGIAAASLDEIAARAGMSKGAIYSNFAGKADLIFELVASTAKRLAPPSKPGPLAAGLRRAALGFAGLLPEVLAHQREQAEFQLYVASEPALAKRLAALQSQVFDEAEREIARYYGDQLAISPRALVLAAQALGIGFLHQYAATPEEITEDVISTTFAALAAGATKAASPR